MENYLWGGGLLTRVFLLRFFESPFYEVVKVSSYKPKTLRSFGVVIDSYERRCRWSSHKEGNTTRTLQLRGERRGNGGSEIHGGSISRYILTLGTTPSRE